MLGGSRAVRDNHLVTRKFAEARCYLIFRDANRTLDVVLFVNTVATHIDDDGRAFLQSLAHLDGGDALHPIARRDVPRRAIWKLHRASSIRVSVARRFIALRVAGIARREYESCEHNRSRQLK